MSCLQLDIFWPLFMCPPPRLSPIHLGSKYCAKAVYNGVLCNGQQLVASLSHSLSSSPLLSKHHFVVPFTLETIPEHPKPNNWWMIFLQEGVGVSGGKELFFQSQWMDSSLSHSLFLSLSLIHSLSLSFSLSLSLSHSLIFSRLNWSLISQCHLTII